MAFKGRTTVKKTVKPIFKGYKVTEETELMVFLIATLPGKNRNNIKTLLRDKFIEVDNKVQTQYNLKLHPGQTVSVRPKKGSVLQATYKGLSIIHEDKYLIVINKNAGFLTKATNKERTKTAVAILQEHVQKTNRTNKIHIVHSIEREMSGVMVFAKTEEIRDALQESWNETIQEAIYSVVVQGKVEKETDTITSYLVESDASLKVHSSQNPKKGKKAITNFETVKVKKGLSLLKVTLETGRKNQIRVHMQDIKHPVIGDKKYGATVSPIDRLGLHLQKLTFKNPITQKLVTYEAPIPKNFTTLFS
jgi:23S rRNA pseudouridine1911/1915/1917 synthase